VKVVLLHDWLTGYRGGERVLEAFCEMFPDAPLYTLIHIPGSTTPLIENRKIVTSWINNFPDIKDGYRKYLPLFPLAANTLKITEDADLIISSSHCVIKGVEKPFGSKHLSYIHSPMRYIYDQFDNYFGKEAPWWQSLGAKAFRPYLQTWDKISNDNVDLIVANSSFVQNRIHKIYERNSEVIYPFVDLKDFASIQKNPLPKEDFYLMVTAFAPNKKVGLAIEAFNRLGYNLKIVGSGQQAVYLKGQARNNVRFLGNLSREKVIDLMARAKGFIFPGVEDFGITPLESLAAGTPLIAFKEGGVLETLNDDVCEFFTESSVVALVEAIKRFELRSFDTSKMQKRAAQFSREIFMSKMKNQIERLLEK
jgi:glycosyltransferase involved in cell wall biosynthesis